MSSSLPNLPAGASGITKGLFLLSFIILVLSSILGNVFSIGDDHTILLTQLASGIGMIALGYHLYFDHATS